jgi:hypothetical protein
VSQACDLEPTAMTHDPLAVVQTLLQNPLDLDHVLSVTTDDVRYVSLDADNFDLTRILPWAGEHRSPQAFVKAFKGIYRVWECKAFDA